MAAGPFQQRKNERTAGMAALYAGEEERQKWAKEWPDDKIPPLEEPRYNRDAKLPKAE